MERRLVLLLLAGACLRAPAILWGMPVVPYHQSFHPDEGKAVTLTAQFPGNYLSHRRFPGYGTTVAYTTGAVLLPVKLAVVRVLHRPDAYEQVVWFASRLVTVLYGLAAIWLTLLAGRALFDPATAWLGAAFTTVSFYHAMNSAVATLDVPSSAWLMAVLLLSARMAQQPRASTAAWLGAAVALLLGTKITAVPFLLVPLAAVLTCQHPRWVLLCGAVAAAVFSLFHPHLFLDPARYAGWFLRERDVWTPLESVSGLGWLAHAAGMTARGGGWPLVPLAIAGAAAGLRAHPAPPAAVRLLMPALLASILAYYALWRLFLPARYLIIVMPALCLFAAHACVRLSASPRRLPSMLGHAAAGAMLAYSAALCAGGLWTRFHDTRPAAAAYLAGALAPGTTVGFSSVSEQHPWTTHAWRYPWVDLSRVREVPLADQPDVVITSSYDLTRITEALRSGHLLPGDRWDPAQSVFWYRHTPPSPALFAFYRALLDPQGPYRLERRFTPRVPAPIEFPPPDIRVYRR